MGGVIVGYDPGAEGAFAVLRRDDRELLAVRDLSYLSKRLDIAWLVKEVRMIESLMGPSTWVMETTMTQSGVQSMQTAAASALNWGLGYASISGCGVALEEVPPGAWKKRMGLTTSKGTPQAKKKETAVAKAVEVFPTFTDVFRPPSARSKSGFVLKDGRAEAALIALDAARRNI